MIIAVIFQENESPGVVCNNCEEVIIKTGYTAMLQFGSADELHINSLNFTICENCYKLSQE